MSFWCFVRFHPLREKWAKMERKRAKKAFFFLTVHPTLSDVFMFFADYSLIFLMS